MQIARGEVALEVHMIEYVRREESAKRYVVFVPMRLNPPDAQLVHRRMIVYEIYESISAANAL